MVFEKVSITIYNFKGHLEVTTVSRAIWCWYVLCSRLKECYIKCVSAALGVICLLSPII